MPPSKRPGPATYTMKPLVGYKDHDFNSKKERGPMWTLGHQAKLNIENKSPGPAANTVEKLTRVGPFFSPAYTMYKRPKDLKPDPNPGPYNAIHPCIYKSSCAPKYSVGKKLKPLNLDQGPGPQAEITPLDIYKHRSPKYPMFSKHKELSNDQGPGANAYNAGESKLRVMNRSPDYSMKVLVRGLTADANPGPAKYANQQYNPFARSPKFSMGRKYCEYMHVPIVPMDNCPC